MYQRTEEWYSARAGKVTASRLSDVIATTKSGDSASRSNYMAQLIAERLTGRCVEGFSSKAMQWGVDTEELARLAYESETGLIVSEVGFIDHSIIEYSGASPDGLVGDDGLIEIKCPETKTHIATLISNKAPSKYIPQMQWQMACTGRFWVDFVSFDPRMPESLQLFIIRVQRDQDLIDKYERSVRDFLSEMEDTITKLKSRGNNA